MIGIVVNDNRIATPIPVGYITDFPRRDAPVPAVEPESARPTAREMPNVSRAEPSSEASVFPRMVQVETRIVSRRVADPGVRSGVYVWRIRMAWMVLKVFMGWRCATCHRRGSMRGDVSASYFRVASAVLFATLRVGIAP